jgi:hypothetical protein
VNYPAVLVRLPKADPVRLRRVVEAAWRFVAPKRLVRILDAPPTKGSTGKAGSR